MKLIVLLAVFGCIHEALCAGAGKYTYGANDPFGPANWNLVNPTCGGSSQSPIDIQTASATPGTEKPIIIDYFHKRITAINMTNTGHSVDFQLIFADKRPNRLYWNGGSDTYLFKSLHFHWTRVGANGSEHTLDGRRFAAEIHLVHFNEKYGDIGAAINQPDGLAVYGVFFELSTSFLPLFDRSILNYNLFTRHLGRVRNFKQSFLVQFLPCDFSLKDLVGAYPDQYFSYQGSLTTPPCSESVRWLVAKNQVRIHQLEVQKFASLLDETGKRININYRPVQPLNGRTVNSYNFVNGAPPASGGPGSG